MFMDLLPEKATLSEWIAVLYFFFASTLPHKAETLWWVVF
jgi:hypothetical protein